MMRSAAPFPPREDTPMPHAGRSRAQAAPPAAPAPARPWPLVPLARHLRQALDAERTLARGYDAGALHVWRVQLRRLIAATDGLARLAPAAEGGDQAVVDELKALRRRSGGSRDLDVLLDATLPGFRARKPQHPPPPALLALLESRREEARGQALATVVGAGLRPLESRLRTWLARRLAVLALPPRALAAALLDERLHQLRRHRRRFRDGPKRLHRLRTAVKNLNYALSLGEGLFDAAAAAPWNEAAAKLQNQLGKAHDLFAGSDFLAELDLSGDDDRFARRFRRWCTRRGAKLADKAAGNADELEALARFWR